MKFKLDENLPQEIGEALMTLGHDADSVHSEGLSGAEDAVVVKAAGAAARILMTLDKGVASLLHYPISEHVGVVLFRPGSFGRGEVLSFVEARLGSLLEMDLAGHLTIVGPTRIRVR